MIRVLWFEGRTATARRGDERLLEDWAAGKPRQAGLRGQGDADLIWVDLHGLDPQTEARLLDRYFGIHPMAIQDAQRDRHPPKLEAFDDYTFLLLKGLAANTDTIHFATIQIAAFAGEGYLVTRHSAESPSVERLWKELETDPQPATRGAWALLLRMTRFICDRYLGLLMELESRLDEIEEEMIENPRDELLHELTRYKADLTRLRRVFVYHEQIFSGLRQAPETPIEQARLRHELNDVYEQLERAGSLTALYYSLVTDLSDSYLSLASHRLNGIMKVLTIITAIFVPLSFVAGVYGMNFEFMPELRSRYGYFMVLSVMGLLVLMLLFVFKRKRWL